MNNFWKLNEDPMYDEDGVLMDEDAEWQDVDNKASEAVFKRIAEELSPFETVNS